MKKIIYVFKKGNISRKEKLESGLLSMIKTGRITQVTSEEMQMVSVEGKICFLVQGDDIIGIAFDYNDACRGFRIMAHQQYADGVNNKYPIEVVSCNDVLLGLPDGWVYSLRYIDMY